MVKKTDTNTERENQCKENKFKIQRKPSATKLHIRKKTNELIFTDSVIQMLNQGRK